MDRKITDLAARLGQTRSEFVRGLLARELFLARFEEFRKEFLPYAEARGYFTDEDIFREVS
jgi:hypothetical protein